MALKFNVWTLEDDTVVGNLVTPDEIEFGLHIFEPGIRHLRNLYGWPSVEWEKWYVLVH